MNQVSSLRRVYYGRDIKFGHVGYVLEIEQYKIKLLCGYKYLYILAKIDTHIGDPH
jgi:hypothetical protein